MNRVATSSTEHRLSQSEPTGSIFSQFHVLIAWKISNIPGFRNGQSPGNMLRWSMSNLAVILEFVFPTREIEQYVVYTYSESYHIPSASGQVVPETYLPHQEHVAWDGQMALSSYKRASGTPRSLGQMLETSTSRGYRNPRVKQTKDVSKISWLYFCIFHFWLLADDNRHFSIVCIIHQVKLFL